jgi:hypothetical protein
VKLRAASIKGLMDEECEVKLLHRFSRLLIDKAVEHLSQNSPQAGTPVSPFAENKTHPRLRAQIRRGHRIAP